MSYLFTSESVSEGHPDKVSDQISDAILDEYLKQDPDSKVACETLVTTGLVFLSGEIHSSANIDVQKITRNVIREIGYSKSEYQFDYASCSILSALHEQSADIRQGVDREDPENQGAGDQGMMFGYATNETDNYMPLALDLSHRILREMAAVRKEGTQMPYLRPDSKAQVTIKYNDEHQPIGIKTVVISTQHDDLGAEEAMQMKIRQDVDACIIPRLMDQLPERITKLFNSDIEYLINPTGKFVIGGPHGDTGLTGRKIIVDTYGGKGAHGGGAFSGKDSSKVDRSAAYATRHIAKNLVAAGIADQVLVQVAYAIGVANPVGLYIDTYNTAKVNLTDGEIAERVNEIFDLRPNAIVNRLGLKNPIFYPTAKYGHMGRDSQTIWVDCAGVEKEFETFTWEKLNFIDQIKKAF